MKLLKFFIVLFTISLCTFSCSDNIPGPRTEDDDDPIIIGDPNDPLPDYPDNNSQDSIWTA